jgi:hypothetical protein
MLWFVSKITPPENRLVRHVILRQQHQAIVVRKCAIPIPNDAPCPAKRMQIVPVEKGSAKKSISTETKSKSVAETPSSNVHWMRTAQQVTSVVSPMMPMATPSLNVEKAAGASKISKLALEMASANAASVLLVLSVPSLA